MIGVGRKKKNEVKITFSADEIAMLDNLCHVWNIRQRATVGRKLIVDSLKRKQAAGDIPKSKDQGDK